MVYRIYLFVTKLFYFGDEVAAVCPDGFLTLFRALPVVVGCADGMPFDSPNAISH